MDDHNRSEVATEYRGIALRPLKLPGFCTLRRWRGKDCIGHNLIHAEKRHSLRALTPERCFCAVRAENPEVHDLRRNHPASSAEPSSAVTEKNPHTASSLTRLVRGS